MRPLAALVLIVGSVAALLFAARALARVGDEAVGEIAAPAVEPKVVADTTLGDLPVAETALRFPDVGRGERRLVEVASDRADGTLGSIRGVVVTPAGDPVRDYRLLVRRSHPTHRAYGYIVEQLWVRDQEDGRFLVRGLKADTYVVQVDARGFAASFSEPVVVEEGCTKANVMVRMTMGGTLVGRVVDRATGRPIADARVRTDAPDSFDSDFIGFLHSIHPLGLTQASVRTDADGRFEIPLMTSETYQIRIRHDDFAMEIRNAVSVADGVTTDVGEISLREGATITGTAYLATGEPAGRAMISLRAVDPKKIYHQAHARCDAKGRFTLAHVNPGRYQLSCSRRVKPGANPFICVVDNHKAKVEIVVLDGKEYVQDLHLPAR